MANGYSGVASGRRTELSVGVVARKSAVTRWSTIEQRGQQQHTTVTFAAHQASKVQGVLHQQLETCDTDIWVHRRYLTERVWTYYYP